LNKILSHNSWKKPICVAGLAFIILLLGSIFRAPISLPSPLKITLIPSSGGEKRNEPIFCYGHPGEADFLFIKYEGENARIGYYPWGMPAVYSAPFHWHIGEPISLTLDLPALRPYNASNKTEEIFLVNPNDQSIDYQAAITKGKLKIKLRDEVILTENVFWHLLRKREVSFGVNNIGGTICNSIFGGNVIIDGVAVKTINDIPIKFEDHLNAWKQFKWSICIWISILSFLTTVLFWAIDLTLCNLKIIENNANQLYNKKNHLIFFISLMVCAIPFLWMLTYGHWSLFEAENFGEFYDYQALSILQNHLDVPLGCLNGEAFIYNGHVFGYWGPTPAIIRIPFVLLDIGFGSLSKLFTLVAYLCILLLSYLILTVIYFFINRNNNKILSNWAVFTVVVNLGLGSTLYFLSSRSFIYHEALIWGMFFCLFTILSSLNYLYINNISWIYLGLISAFFAHFSRPPAGLMAFGFLCSSVLYVFIYRIIQNNSRIHNFIISLKLFKHSILVVIISILSISSLGLLSYIKFHDITVCPVRLNLQYTPERLSKFNNKLFHLSNIRNNFELYVYRSSLTIHSKFPYIRFQRNVLINTPEARMDLVEKTASIVWSMPLFTILVFLAFIYSINDRFARNIKYISLVGSVPMIVAMLSAVAVTHRYIVDFMSLIYVISCIGVSSLHFSKMYKYIILFMIILSIFINFNITYEYQKNECWGVSTEYK